MDANELSQHYSQTFDAELKEIQAAVLAMGGIVEKQIEEAIEALTKGNSALAERVVATDSEVNVWDLRIDQKCTSILARRQPTASDLRMVLAVIKANADLERIGDEVKRVAKMAISLSGAGQGRSIFLQIEQLGQQVRQMLHDALDAFARMDVEAALRLVQEDQRIDSQYENIMRQSVTYMMEDPRTIPLILDIVWSARSLERIGDRCCNICGYVIYFVKGKNVRHLSLERLKEELS